LESWKATNTLFSIPELKATVMRFTDESWKLYTPFKVQLYKNGVLKDEQVVNTLGGTETITLTADSPEETVKIQNFGKIGTGLQEPEWDLLIFDEAHIFKVEGNIINEIQYDKDPYSYSNYWFGGWRTLLCSRNLWRRPRDAMA